MFTILQVVWTFCPEASSGRLEISISFGPSTEQCSSTTNFVGDSVTFEWVDASIS